MIEKIKQKIDENKADKETFKEYIKSFTECKEAVELFKNDESFKKILEEKEDIKKEEDEYF